LIGFYVKTDLNGIPIRDKKNEFIPEHPTAGEIGAGDKVVYYTRGDHLIRGIFEVSENLREGDDRRAKDWTHGLIQFAIKPILKPISDVDFRNIIFSGKEDLDMFSHLDNLKKQWGMSLYRLNEIVLVYPKSEEQRFYIVGPETLRNDFNEKMESLTFQFLTNANCSFQSYEEIDKIFQESQKKKPKL